MENKKELFVVILVLLGTSIVTNADHLHEVRVLTSNCGECGMAAFFGQLSVKVTISIFLIILDSSSTVEVFLYIRNLKPNYLYVQVCGKNAVAPSICCVAANIASDSRFKEGKHRSMF